MREGQIVRFGQGDYVARMEEDPERIAADRLDFGVPFFVGTWGVAFKEEVMGFCFGLLVGK